MRTKIEGSEGSKANQRAFLLAWCKMMARGWEENPEVLKAQMNIIADELEYYYVHHPDRAN